MSSTRSKTRSAPPPLASTSSSSPDPTPIQTPSFTPNAPPPFFSESQTSLDTLEAEAKQAEKELDLDLDLPISTLLREGTKRAHIQAENSAGAEALVKGQLPLEEYIKWLAVLWRVYDALELALSTHSSDSVLEPTYDPSLLARGAALTSDITHLLTLLPESTDSIPATTSTPASPSTPLPPFPMPHFLEPIFNSPPPALADFISHIHHLSTSTGGAPLLLAHAYVRYLGDLSGGQIIGGRIRRAYGLKGKAGTAFYDFSARGEKSGFESDPTGEAGKKRLTDIKDWYRRGMNDGVGEDRGLKEKLVAEANLAFALNTRLFALVPPPPAKSASTSGAQTRTGPPPTMPSMDGGLGLVPMMLIGFCMSWAVGHYVMPEIYRILGF